MTGKSTEQKRYVIKDTDSGMYWMGGSEFIRHKKEHAKQYRHRRTAEARAEKLAQVWPGNKFAVEELSTTPP